MSSDRYMAERALKRKEAFNADMIRIRKSVLEYLRLNGPTEINVLADAIKASKGRMAFAGIIMAKDGVLHRYRVDGGKDRKSRRVWSLYQKAIVKEPKSKEKKSKVDIYIDDDDLKWMEYWRDHSANKRRMHENHH